MQRTPFSLLGTFQQKKQKQTNSNHMLLNSKCLDMLVLHQGCSQEEGGGSLGSEEPHQTKKGPLECTKRSTRMHKKIR